MGTGELLIERLGRAARVPRMGTWWTVDGLMLALEWSGAGEYLELTFGASS